MVSFNIRQEKCVINIQIKLIYFVNKFIYIIYFIHSKRGIMKQTHPPFNFKATPVRQNRGQTWFQNVNKQKVPLSADRPKKNVRNYFNAQKHKESHRPSSSSIYNTSKYDNYAKQFTQTQRQNNLRTFTSHSKSSVKPAIALTMNHKHINNSKSFQDSNPNQSNTLTDLKYQNPSPNCVQLKRDEVFNQQILIDVNTMKLSSYHKKRQRRVGCYNYNVKRRSEIQTNEAMKRLHYVPEQNLNIIGFKHNAFWSQPSSAHQAKKINSKMSTEEFNEQEIPNNTFIRYKSNYAASPDKISQNYSIKRRIRAASKISDLRISQNQKGEQKPNINSNRHLIRQVDYFGTMKSQLNLDQIQLMKVKYYRDIIWKIWYNSNQKVVVSTNQPSPKYFIGRGNNSKLIKSIMSKRWWWKLQTKQENANFLWTQLKIYSVYQSQQCAPQTSVFQELNDPEQELQWPQKNYPLQPFIKACKNSFLLTPNKYKNWHNYIHKSKKLEYKSSQLLQTRKPLQTDINVLSKYPNKVSNHLEYSRMIGNKKALYKTMMLYFKVMQKSNKYLPVTYHVTSGLQDEEYLKFLNQYYYRAKNINNTNWIVKPGEMSNRGNGITVCQQLNDIKKIIKNRKCHSNGTPYTYIIQEYLDKPFLYHGRKFDIRHYIMITSTNGRIQGYFYQEGYIRTTSYKYTINNQKASVHLTNDAVQKYCKDYGKYQQGNKVSYDQFQKYLQKKYQGQYSFYQTILPKIRQICIELINSCYYIIDPKRRANNFEIFGLDIMIDQNFKPWLIEANTNPCLELSSKVLARLIPKMLDNAFMIAVDPLFPPPPDIITRKVKLPDSCINQNRFQLVFDEAVDGKKLNELYSSADKGLNMDGFASDQEAYQSADEDCEAH